MLVLGGALAGLSGAVLVGFINLWAPSAWGYAETIVLFAAVIIGGAGNHRGAVLGAILVPVGFEEATRYIPQFGPAGLVDDLQWVAIGLLIVLFLWFRPQGVLPERRRRIGAGGPPSEIPNGDVVTLARASPAPGRPEPARQDGSPRDGGRPLLTRSASSPAPPDAGPVLRTAGLTRDFGGVHAVTDVSVEVRHGTLTGLIGPNGAGKSTLLGMLAGTIGATAGQVIYQGADVAGMPAYRRARLGLVRTFQLASEFKRLTVMENLLSAVPANRGDSLAGALRGRRYWRRDEEAAIERARALLDRFGLSRYADTYAGDLSGGQRRLTEIMRALMTEPAMLLLDEPMAGVHPRLARQIGAQLLGLCAGHVRALAEAGVAVLIVEQRARAVLAISDYTYVLGGGQVLMADTPAQLTASQEFTESFFGTVPQAPQAPRAPRAPK